MKFLIVTSVLNGADFLEETLASVANQTWRAWRHVIIDAGSTDGSREIIETHVSREARAELVVMEGVGLYEAILAGFAQRDRSETLLSWLNADDLYAPWALAVAAEAFAQDADLKWLSGLPAIWDREGRLRAVSPAGPRSRRLIAAGWHHDAALGCLQQETMFFGAELLESLSDQERARISAMELAGDFVLWREFARRARLGVAPSVLGGFRVHGDNRSLTSSGKYEEEVRAAGGVFPPRWLAKRLRSISDAASAYACLRASRRAQRLVHGGRAER